MAKIVKEEIRASDNHRIVTFASGVQRDETTGRIIQGPTDAKITPETSQYMHQARRNKALEGHILGTIDGSGIELPPNPSHEEITIAYGNSIRAIVGHHVETFMKSGNLRGMGESLTKILAPVMVEPDVEAWQRRANEQQTTFVQSLTELVRLLKEPPTAIEGKIIGG